MNVPRPLAIRLNNGVLESFERFAHRVRHPVLLYSSDPGHAKSQTSYLAGNPIAIICSINGVTSVQNCKGEWSHPEPPPLEALEQFLHDHYGKTHDAGIAIGYLGYELGTQIEKIPRAASDILGLPDYWFAFYDCYARIAQSDPSQAWIYGENQSTRDFETIIRQAQEVESYPHTTINVEETPLKPTWDLERYRTAFERIKKYIFAGDIYQANLAYRFTAPFYGNPATLFTRLARSNPAPFSAYLDCGDHQILSNSPECFLQVTGDRIVTCPIKGTRPRSLDAAEDNRLRHALETSHKDAAEHVMIVDLERNDLGRICQIGSVGVEEMKHVESFSRVHHLVTSVRGQLRQTVHLPDILKATFPGGSITGAPKIRAMEIIAEVEGETRGVYTGAMGILGPGRMMNLSIAIRTAIIKENYIHFHSGGGIVADSNPEDEYEETFHKARAFLEGLGGQK